MLCSFSHSVHSEILEIIFKINIFIDETKNVLTAKAQMMKIYVKDILQAQKCFLLSFVGGRWIAERNAEI